MSEISDQNKQSFSERNTVMIKAVFIAIITLLLLIPAAMISNLVYERQNTKNEAINEIGEKWGKEQTITGPFLTIPFTKHIKRYSPKDSTDVWIERTDYLNMLPENLNVTGSIAPEKRYRGIFEVIVYNSDISLDGDFSTLNIKDFDIEAKDLHLNNAFLSIGISDLRGIEEQIDLKWGENTKVFNPGTITTNIISSGINAPLNISVNSNGDILSEPFAFNLKLKGSEYLRFIPVGKITDVELKSDWSTPSFDGAFLPDHRTVSDSGFVANWNVLHLNRNYPQAWLNSDHRVQESAFGVDLLLPVDNYKKSERSIKYAILFIGLTFLVFFFIEIINKKRVHPIQYILVGLALCLFYTLLLSISEHSSFNFAYLASSVLTIGLISAYTKTVLKSTSLTGLMSGILTILYLFIYVIIQLEDYALLMGSIGLFIILALVMYFSRKIDWYQINNEVKL
ncbi:MAG: cell envelope integrity protein CreD [Balneola sp.]|nr:cell envelope integrity protein CreD [Balneola sp.]MBO6651539.1 cell envelope integrity protein CreD [Balneola sp.]MBO6710251.1 cell envelope integrity protein CreD [Balneola sp.]MBO6798936.1 cell envelope integrity protein CreD [Balneola sp.]MBO6870050.1 cell envelope integrity protein CreD [Balneola sp.]